MGSRSRRRPGDRTCCSLGRVSGQAPAKCPTATGSAGLQPGFRCATLEPFAWPSALRPGAEGSRILGPEDLGLEGRLWRSRCLRAPAARLCRGTARLQPGRGTTPWPSFNPLDQTGLHRVGVNIRYHCPGMPFVAYETVPILPLPDSSHSLGRPDWSLALPADAIHMRCNPPARKRLSRGHDICHRPATQRLKEHVHVIGHDRPGKQAVAFPIEMQKHD
jgi:hypothetical protein